ncbi:hypothetical protein M0P98_00975 [bacterium]|nr:hypothetical protein [bacterium]
MIRELPQLKIPTWLNDSINNINNKTQPDFNLENILQNSLYYPACGLNGTPVKYLTGNIHSFVYADYMVTKEEFSENLNGTAKDCGFKGYHSIYQREILKNEILPDNWDFKLSSLFLFRENEKRRESGSKLLTKQQALAKYGVLGEWENQCEPFAHWSIWLKNPDSNFDEPLKAFSFLFLCGEMSAIYLGLYCRLKIVPTVLSIIQPGGGFGLGWEAADYDNSFFKKVVALNEVGSPPYLLYGGWGDRVESYVKPCWHEYEGEILTRLPERRAGLWKLNDNIHSKLIKELPQFVSPMKWFGYNFWLRAENFLRKLEADERLRFKDKEDI